MQKTYPIIIEKSVDGYYAECPSVQGVYAQGNSESEVVSNLKEVLLMTLEGMRTDTLTSGIVAAGPIESVLSVPSYTFSAITV
jgi:predicted RNase H-like HicB family nuclease